MNKDIKGLIVYLLLMSIIWTFPFLVLYFSFGVLYYDNSTLLVILYLLQTIAFFILYFILPVILIYFAIKKHWSKYLDRFFLHKWWPTILLLFFIFLHSTEHIFNFRFGSENIVWGPVCLIVFITEIFIAPTYYFTYLNLLIFRKKLLKFAEQNN